MTFQVPFYGPPIRSGDLAFTIRPPEEPASCSRGTIIFATTLHGSPAQHSTFPSTVHPAVQELLMMGGRRPYTHQAQTARHFLEERQNVSLVTPTASGKTVSFLASGFSLLLQNPTNTGIMIYPTNALAADQLKVIQGLGFVRTKGGLYEKLVAGSPIRVGVLNGETSDATRRAIRARANLILTNHAAMHHVLLANANFQYKDGSSWNRIQAGLKFVVIDEGHSYNGVSGTNAALAFKRLILLAYKRSGSFPQVLMASATIGNPTEHAANLTGLGNWSLVDKSGAASFSRDFSMLVPNPFPDGRGTWPASTVAMDLAIGEVRQSRRVLMFFSSRVGAEKAADKLNDRLHREVAVPFHAGIPKKEKAEFLDRILKGKVEVICSTSALELGVDIGGMDTVIMVGYPGDHASFIQRLGRVGRTGHGNGFLVLDENQHPLNCYLAGNPEAIFWPAENRTIYPSNRIVATRHAACGMLETRDPELVELHFPGVKEEDLQKAITDKPYDRIAMVGNGNYGQWKAMDPNGKAVQELGGEAALFYWHMGATIRSPKGEFFRVHEVDLKRQIVSTTPVPGRIYTSPKILTEKHAIEQTLTKVECVPLEGVIDAVEGEFDVHRFTIGYMESQQGGLGIDQVQTYMLAPEDLNPPIGILTRGAQFALKIDHPLAVAMMEYTGGLQAVQDAMGLSVALLVQARAEDVPVQISLDGEYVCFFTFDMAEGGMGWAEQLVRNLDRWMVAAGKALLNCSCKMQGCPRCSLSPCWGDDRKKLAEAMVIAGSESTK